MTRRLVVDLCYRRPVWRVPAEVVAAIGAAVAPGWEVVEVRSPVSSDGDGETLLALLDGGRLRGAALDVFATEPLLPGHPFSVHPRVLVSPHVSPVTEPLLGAGSGPHSGEREALSWWSAARQRR